MTEESGNQIHVKAMLEVHKMMHDWIANEKEQKIFIDIVDSIILTFTCGGKIIFFGNGGSAAEALHLAAEFVGKCEVDIGPHGAISLSDSSPVLTALSNDWNFDEIFARQIKALARTGDLLIGLSTSGSSVNVLNALAEGKRLGLKTSLWTSTRFKGESSFVDFLLVAPTIRTPRAQELHLILGHILCEYVESEFKNKR